VTTDLLLPTLQQPNDLEAIESVPLAECGLPESTYALLKCAAALWPDRIAVTVMPNADRWQQPSTRTFSQLLADVNTAANMLRHTSIGRGSPTVWAASRGPYSRTDSDTPSLVVTVRLMPEN
jgi:fatty-acyl-CoA synthase